MLPPEKADAVSPAPVGLSDFSSRAIRRSSWRQGERGALILVRPRISHGLAGRDRFAWGTPISLLLVIGFAFAEPRAFSATDAIRQYAFPVVRHRRVSAVADHVGPWVRSCYGPALALASAVFSWPITTEERPSGWLSGQPLGLSRSRSSRTPGETRSGSESDARAPGPRMARIVAGPEQRIEWSDKLEFTGRRPGSLRRTLAVSLRPDRSRGLETDDPARSISSSPLAPTPSGASRFREAGRSSTEARTFRGGRGHDLIRSGDRRLLL